MVRGALFKKSLRDMAKSKAQFISIFIMATLAVTIMTGLDSIWFSVKNNADAMYSATNLSDLWVNVYNPSERDMWGIEKIEGVEQAEKRFSAESDTDLFGNPTLQVYALDEKSALDQPEIIQGRFSSGAVLGSAFAKAHNLKVGDSISIKLNGVWTRLYIDGLALSSEQVSAVKNSTSLSPNHAEYGFIVVHSGALESVFGQKVYNQISVKTLPGADFKEVVQKAGAVIGDRLIGIVLKKDSVSVSSVNGRIQQFRTLSFVFPLLFFLVTALITQSTMMRLVENQRTQIGILKALGYSKASILWHYASYGVMVGVLGSISGLLIGLNLFARYMVTRLQLTLSSYSLYVNFWNFAFASVLILLCTGGVSFYACWKLQKDSPAVLLRDKPPKAGKHIFLESISSVWDKMKFSSKLIVRNTLKNKGRLIMSIIGVMGCVGVIIAALSIRSTIAGITDQMYGDTFSYDQKVLIDTKKADFRYINNLGLNGVTQLIQESAVQVILPNGEQKMEPITVLTKDSPLIHMRDAGGESISLDDDSIVMTRKLCSTLGVNQGDSIQIKRTGKGYASVKITNVAYMASGQGIYIADSYWKSLGETFSPTALLIKWEGAPDQRFLKSDVVTDSATRESQHFDLSSNMGVLTFAVVALIIMGASLAFVVLYNTGILNFSERVRDLATFRVLGFHHSEIRSLVLAENYFSTFAGMLAGIPVGRFISWLIASSLDDRLDLMGDITLGNVLIAAAMTLFFSWATNRIIAKKMKKIEMLEALKSVE